MIPLPFEEEPDRLSSLERALSLPRAKRGNVSDFCNFYLQRWQVEDLTSRIALRGYVERRKVLWILVRLRCGFVIWIFFFERICAW